MGLTATPIRNDSSGLKDIYDTLVEVSDIKTLTSQGFLVPCKVYAPTIPDLKGVATVRGDYDARELDKRMNQVKLVGDLVEHWIKFALDRPTVVFASSVAHSKYIAKIFKNNGKLRWPVPRVCCSAMPP